MQHYFEKSAVARSFAWFFILMQSLFPGGIAYAMPHGENVVSGKAGFSTVGSTMTITQSSQTLKTNWNSFNIWNGQSVKFIQPNSSALAINNILGNSASKIFGNISANGQVWLINPNGILFGSSSVINTRGFLASALSLSGSTTNPVFSGGNNSANISNAGDIQGQYYLAMIGPEVSNAGQLGSQKVDLLSGNNLTLTFADNSLLSYQISDNFSNSLVSNSGKISANGGSVWLAAGAKESLLKSVVNNTGIIDAQTVGDNKGQIVLLSGLSSGTTTVGGTLNASSHGSGAGGNIETSGNRVNILSGAQITTKSENGKTGNWTIDPASFYIGKNTSGIANNTYGNVLNYEDISATSLETAIGSSNVTIYSTNGNHGAQGNIYIDSAINYNSPNELKLYSANNIQVNSAVVNAGYGEIRLRADYMAIGGAATVTQTNGTPSGVGAVNVNTGGSLSTVGPLHIYTNPYNYGVSATNTGSSGGNYTNLGTGTLYVYDLLSTNEDLYWIDQNQTSQVLANNYALNQNITLPSFGATGVGGAQILYATNSNGFSSPTSSTYSNWVPFGSSSNIFVGVFNNGTQHSVSNMQISNNINNYAGFFGELDNTVQNFGVEGNINMYIGVGAGGIVGLNTGQIITSFSNVTLNSSVAVDLGGIVGENFELLRNDFSTGEINGTGHSGGLVGFMQSGVISNSFSSGKVFGSVAGGLVGFTTGSTGVYSSYNTGTVTASSIGGGLIGQCQYCNLYGSYSTGKVYGISGGQYGAIVGQICNSALNAGSDYYNTNAYVYGGNTTGVGSSTSPVIGVLGMSQTQFGTSSNFSGFSFNTFSGGTFTKNSNYPWTMGTNPGGIAAPILIEPMGTATVSAQNKTTTYSGTTYSGGNSTNETTSMLASPIATTGITYGGDWSAAVNAGTYSIDPSGLTLSAPTTQNGIASINYLPGSLTITPATLSVSTTASKIYDGNQNISLTSGNTTLTGVSGQTALLNTNIVGQFSTPNAGVNLGGNLLVTGSELTGNSGFIASNYTLPTIFEGGTITKATLTVTAKKTTGTSGNPIPSLSGSVSGFVPGQSMSGDGGSVKFQTAATPQSPAGIYSITGTVNLLSPYMQNYDIIQSAGNLSAFDLVSGPKKLLAPIFQKKNLDSSIASSIQILYGTSYLPGACETDMCSDHIVRLHKTSKTGKGFVFDFDSSEGAITLPETINSVSMQDIK